MPSRPRLDRSGGINPPSSPCIIVYVTFSNRAFYILVVWWVIAWRRRRRYLARLDERGEQVGVLVVGGGRLLLLGVVERPTGDVDVVRFAYVEGPDADL